MAAFVYFVGPDHVFGFRVNHHDARFKSAGGAGTRSLPRTSPDSCPACTTAGAENEALPLGVCRYDKKLGGRFVEGKSDRDLLLSDCRREIGFESAHGRDHDPRSRRDRVSV